MTPTLRKSEAVILDTSVIVAGFRSPSGASAELIRLALNGSFQVASSIAVFLEYQDVLQREEQRRVHRRTEEQVNVFLSTLASKLIGIDIHFSWRPQLRDPDDEMVLDAAIAGEVKAIVTHNVKDFLPAANSFGIRVVTPSQFLEERRMRV
jgi:putative PIN family toxin of toxin-antitoxin system